MQDLTWNFDNTYSRLPDFLFTHVTPTPVREPSLIIFNSDLAQELGLGAPEVASAAADIFSGNQLPPGAQPLAQAYAGHQYGHFTKLGDGRALLLGEVITPAGQRLDIQLKGSGPTPYSRRGDGRAALGPMLREYLISEAMFALGVPTTRSLAVVATGEQVQRETSLPGAVLTRVAASHIRVGTFEYAAAFGGADMVKTLLNYSVQRHFPEIASSSNQALDFLRAVSRRQARLLAQWVGLGFIHGVMNTDNMAISGETIDYGPCAFMDVYDPQTVFSSIDQHGRYAYAQQPQIAQWNLARLAETLVPWLADQESEAVKIAETALDQFRLDFTSEWHNVFRRKLGFFSSSDQTGTTQSALSQDKVLIEELFQLMQKARADFTNTFVGLTYGADALPTHDSHRFLGSSEFLNWQRRWLSLLTERGISLSEAQAMMKKVNPTVIPRNHLVEAALAEASEVGRLDAFENLLSVLKAPYDLPANSEVFMRPPLAHEQVEATFCGT